MRTKSIRAFFVLFILSTKFFAQLSGSYTVPISFSTVGAAITALNTQGVNGAVTININTGHTETVSAAGYTLGVISGASAINQVTFKKNGAGAAPILYAYSGGTATPVSGAQDGIWKFVGTDYVTVDGIVLIDPNTSNPATMEFGFGFFRVNAADGCQNNTIKSCSITLNRINNAAGSFPSPSGAAGIELLNASASAQTAAITPTATTGGNSNNKFYNNLIQNCNSGIVMYGYYSGSSPYTGGDFNNDIGGFSAATGNTIINYGGGGTAQPAYGVTAIGQYGANLSYNSINNNNGSGINHAQTLKGISILVTAGATVAITGNTISVKGGGTTDQVYGIDNQSGATTGSVNISYNLISNCTYTTSTTGSLYGIFNSASAANLAISNNTLTGFATSQTNGNFNLIYNSGSPSNLNILNNTLKNTTLTANSSVDFYGIRCNAYLPTSTVNINGNSIESFTTFGTFSGQFSFIYNYSQVYRISLLNNTAINLTIPTTSYCMLLFPGYGAEFVTITGNSITGSLTMTSPGSTFYGLICAYSSSTVGLHVLSNNNFSNIVTTSTAAVFPIYAQLSYSTPLFIDSNTITAVSAGSGSLTAIHAGGGTYAVISNNKISNLSGSGMVMGINSIYQAQDSVTVKWNTISYLSSSGPFTVTGYNLNQGTYNLKFLKNTIYDLSGNHAGSVVKGVYITAGFTTTVEGNMIGNLSTPVASHSNAITGLYLDGSSPAKVYYNTVHLYATSTGSVFGTTAFYNYGSTVDLRNNIFVNKSIPVNNGRTIAMRSAFSYTGSYTSGCNNNILYAGVPSSICLLYSNSTTSCQTIGAFQLAAAPNETNSASEDVPFASTTGSNSAFLHISASVATAAESGGSQISGFSNDIDSQIRQGNAGYSGSGSAPDIGADEFSGIPNPCSAVSGGTASALANNLCPGQSTTLNVTGQTAASSPITYQWKNGNSSTGPFNDVTFGTGANTATFNTGTLSAGVYYLVMVTTCTVTSNSATSSAVAVTVNPNPTISVNSGTVCSGAAFTITPAGAATYTFSSGLAVVNPVSNSSYTVTGTSAAGCLSGNSAVSQVTVVSLPTVAVNSGSVCSGNSFTLVPSGATTYSIQGGSTVVTPITSAAYTVTGFSAGCQSASFAVSNVSVVASPTISAANGSVCPGKSFTIIPTGAVTYTITGGTFTVSPLSNSSYSITGNGTGGCPSTNTAVVNITLYSNPTVAVNSGTVCAGTSYVLFPTGAFTYTYLNGSQTVTPTANTAYSIVGTSTAGCVSSNTAVSFVTVFSIPVIAVNSGSICSGNSFTIQPSGANTYSIQGSNAIVNPLSSSTYTVVGFSSAGCQSATYAVSSVSVVASPTLTVNSGTICQGSVFTISPSGAVSYSITGGSNTVSPIATTFYSVTGTGIGGCAATNTAVSGVTVFINPTVTVNSGNVCAGQVFTFMPTGAFLYNYPGGTSTVAPTVYTTYTVTGTSTAGCVSNLAISNVSVIPLPIVTVNSGTVCSGSAFTIIPSGANSYTIQGGTAVVSPQNSSSYTVAGTSQAGCVSSVAATASVTVIALPTVTISGPNSVCNGSSITLTATGASTYSWSTSALSAVISLTPASSTVYTVTGIASSGCQSAATRSITVHALPLVTANSTTTKVCSGNPVTLFGGGAVNYAWSAGISNNVAFNPVITNAYTVTGTDLNGCQAVATITVTVNNSPLITASANNTAICEGASVILTAVGASTYAWSGGVVNNTVFFPTITGTYIVTGTDANGCAGAASIAVIVNSLPALTVASTSSMICEGETVTLTVSGANLYAWNNGGNANNIIVSPTVSTNYSVTGTDLNGCSRLKTITQNVNPCNNLATSASFALNVHPNPTTGLLVLSGAHGPKRVSVSDLWGRIVSETESSQESVTLDLSLLANGIYMVTLKHEGTMQCIKVIKQ
jgi:hypothetical protein